MILQRARIHHHQSSSVLVTIQGPTQTVDLELPMEAPVGNLITLLLPMCVTREEQHPGDHQPVWVLGIEGNPPFGMHETLMSHNITDGAKLLLTDFNAPRFPKPVPKVVTEPAVSDIPVKVPDDNPFKSLMPYIALFAIGVMAVYGLSQVAFPSTAPAFTLSGPAYMALPAILRNHDSRAEHAQNLRLNLATTTDATTLRQKGPSVSSNKANPVAKSTAKTPAKPNPKQQSQQWVKAAVHAHDTKNDNLAILDYQKAIQSNPSNSDAYIHLGDIYRYTNNPLAAVECYQQALHIDPSNFHAWTNLAECQYTLGQKAGALKTLNTAMHTLSSNDDWSLWTLQQFFH